MTQTGALKNRILDLVKELNRHGAAVTGELMDVINGTAEAAEEARDE